MKVNKIEHNKITFKAQGYPSMELSINKLEGQEYIEIKISEQLNVMTVKELSQLETMISAALMEMQMKRSGANE